MFFYGSKETRTIGEVLSNEVSYLLKKKSRDHVYSIEHARHIFNIASEIRKLLAGISENLLKSNQANQMRTIVRLIFSEPNSKERERRMKFFENEWVPLFSKKNIEKMLRETLDKFKSGQTEPCQKIVDPIELLSRRILMDTREFHDKACDQKKMVQIKKGLHGLIQACQQPQSKPNEHAKLIAAFVRRYLGTKIPSKTTPKGVVMGRLYHFPKNK